LLLLFLGVTIPGSPIHLSVLLAPAPSEGGRSVGQWTRALSDPNPDVRREAADALRHMGTDAHSAVPRLGEVMRRDTDPGVRAAAAGALTMMAPASRTVVRELAGALSDPVPLVRMYAALALLNLKSEAAPAVPELLEAVADEDNDTDLESFPLTIRQAALRALGTAAAGTGAAVPALSDILSRPTQDTIRAGAVRGLGLAAAHARGAAPLIRGLLSDPDPDVRFEAAEALARIGAPRDGPVHRGEFDNLELPEPERKRIWEIEHRGNALNTYGFEPLAAALARSDVAALGRFLAPDFTGSEPTAPTRVRVSGFADAERLEDSGAAPVALAPAQFVARLVELRQKVGAAAKVKLVVATLKPKDPNNLEGSWEGLALLRIYGESAPGAPAEVAATIAYEVRAPGEAALAPGGWLRAAHFRELGTSRSPHYLFAETAKARGLNTALHDNWTAGQTIGTTGGVYVTDFDRDGYLDVLVTDVSGNTLYRGGPGGTFTDVTERVGLPRVTST
jgi:HEAT repeat protein